MAEEAEQAPPTEAMPALSPAQKRRQPDLDLETASLGPEPLQTGSPPAKKTRLSLPDGDDVSIEGFQGEIIGTNPDTIASAGAQGASRQSSKKDRGWNPGVKGSLRTSFGSLKLTAPSTTTTNGVTTQPVSSNDSMRKWPSDTKPISSIYKSTDVDNDDKVERISEISPSANSGTTTIDQSKANMNVEEAVPIKAEEPQPEQLHTFRRKSQTWTLPGYGDLAKTSPSPEIWQARFPEWLETFMALNEEVRKASKDEINRGRITQTFGQWLVKGKWLSKEQRKDAQHAIRSLDIDALLLPFQREGQKDGSTESRDKEATESRRHDEAGSQVREQGQTPDTAYNVTTDLEEDAEAYSPSLSLHEQEKVAYTPEDIADLQKYFPGVTTDDIFCMLCASKGHQRQHCPSGTCWFCQKADHRYFACPTRRRCAKCKQLGHASDNCREKLALAPGERECAFCRSRDHEEINCEPAKRSYLPAENSVVKVNLLPIHCYCCGAQGHFGSECARDTARRRPVAFETWSSKYASQFVDPTSTNVAIIWDAAPGLNGFPTVADERPNLGKSIVPRTHIMFEDDDDDDEAEGFIRPPVQRPTAPSRMQLPSQKGGGYSALGSNGHQGGHGRAMRSGNNAPSQTSFNPPLPPGPPPPLPANSLPDRPPAPASQGRGGKQNGSSGKEVQRRQGQSQRDRNRGGTRRGGHATRGKRGKSSRP